MRKTLIFVFCSAVVMAGALAANRSLPAAKQNAMAPVAPLSEFRVGALGRIEPQSEVIHVNAPSVMEPPVVEKIMVARHIARSSVNRKIQPFRLSGFGGLWGFCGLCRSRRRKYRRENN